MKKIAFSLLMMASSLYAISCSSTTTSKTDNPNAVINEASTPSNSPQDSTKSSKTIIVDVRTPEEWTNDGHADCTTLIPLNELESKIETLRSYDKIVFVCRSGGRAGRAKELLESKGFTDVSNAGPWQNAPCK